MVPRSNVRRRYTGLWAGLRMAPPNSPTATATSAAISNDAQRGSHDLQPRNVMCLPLGTSDTVLSANARSRADWKRLSGSFSRQCRTICSNAAGTSFPPKRISGGSSLSTAVIVSTSVSPEKALAGKHFIQHGTETENVAAMIHGFSAELLGRHVSHGAQH